MELSYLRLPESMQHPADEAQGSAGVNPSKTAIQLIVMAELVLSVSDVAC